MSDLGDDLKEVHQDVGTSFNIVRESGNVAGGYMILKENAQVTKPFIREFFMEGRISYDTDLVTGDVFISSDGRPFMVMNLTPKMFEDSVIEYTGVLYQCNVSGELFRPSGETWDGDYHLQQEWVSVKSTCYALQTEALYGHDLETDEELGMLGIQNHELYIPRSVGAQIHDRYEAVSGEYYWVETIKKRRYPSVVVCEIGEDRR
nr:hypothetical protein 9 [bacterium]